MVPVDSSPVSGSSHSTFTYGSFFIFLSLLSHAADTGNDTEMDGTPSRITSRMVVPASVTPPLSATTSL